jgi:hypothetical protein
MGLQRNYIMMNISWIIIAALMILVTTVSCVLTL